jgi:hypothetical protein
MAKVNKDFHSKFQPTRFTTSRIKAGIACQTSRVSRLPELAKLLERK